MIRVVIYDYIILTITYKYSYHPLKKGYSYATVSFENFRQLLTLPCSVFNSYMQKEKKKRKKGDTT